MRRFLGTVVLFAGLAMLPQCGSSDGGDVGPGGEDGTGGSAGSSTGSQRTGGSTNGAAGTTAKGSGGSTSQGAGGSTAGTGGATAPDKGTGGGKAPGTGGGGPFGFDGGRPQRDSGTTGTGGRGDTPAPACGTDVTNGGTCSADAEDCELTAADGTTETCACRTGGGRRSDASTSTGTWRCQGQTPQRDGGFTRQDAGGRAGGFTRDDGGQPGETGGTTRRDGGRRDGGGPTPPGEEDDAG